MEISNYANDEHQATISAHRLEELLIDRPSKRPTPARSQPEVPLKCPRCDSSNTKFCYFNNYSLSQPRHFCKSCRRYWTSGGSLRNVPIGGGCRKNKKLSPLSSASPLSSSPPSFSIIPSRLSLSGGADLTLAIERLQKHHKDYFLPSSANHDQFFSGNPNPNSAAGFLNFMRNEYPENGMKELEGISDSASSSWGIRSCMGMDEHECKMMMGMQWPLIGGDDGMGVMECSSWHGAIVNSSLL